MVWWTAWKVQHCLWDTVSTLKLATEVVSTAVVQQQKRVPVPLWTVPTWGCQSTCCYLQSSCRYVSDVVGLFAHQQQPVRWFGVREAVLVVMLLLAPAPQPPSRRAACRVMAHFPSEKGGCMVWSCCLGPSVSGPWWCQVMPEIAQQRRALVRFLSSSVSCGCYHCWLAMSIPRPMWLFSVVIHILE